MVDLRRLERVRTDIENQLLSEAGVGGHWEGRLSSSALATSVALVALLRAAPHLCNETVAAAAAWLEANQNPDGGWGDSPESRSNLSATLLCWSALGAAAACAEIDQRVVDRGQEWLLSRTGGLDGPSLAAAVLEFYGNDRTFSAPILLMTALSGRLDDQWRLVPQLPLEVAGLPQRLFRWLRLPVVSYALPALIAVGLARHRQAPTRLAPLRWLRNALIPGLLRTLTRLQPENGGFLEAAPLTGFVVMSLAAAGLRDHAVVSAGVAFLRRCQRADGSWPIDSNLATWVTTRAVEALTTGEEACERLPEIRRSEICGWLLDQQLSDVHPFTGAAPGGWAWTDLPGAVPDADDTAGALLALRRLGVPSPAVCKAAAAGVLWLLDLQNRDGGVPTFCRGWGRLPFDRSCPDITAHAVRAWVGWRGDLAPELVQRLDAGVKRGLRFLARAQRRDGSWVPLWFGNQWAESEHNPIYGTAQVLDALSDPGLAGLPRVEKMVARARSWLISAQSSDGGWGRAADGGSTVEETALALAVLAEYGDLEIVERGTSWLIGRLAAPRLPAAEPIGLYFASLWYSEKLYPMVFSVRALRRVAGRLADASGYAGRVCETTRQRQSAEAWRQPAAVGG